MNEHNHISLIKEKYFRLFIIAYSATILRKENGISFRVEILVEYVVFTFSQILLGIT